MRKAAVWVLTVEYNDYDQHGEYFLAVFGSKPTPQELLAEGVAEADVGHVLQGGGRVGHEDIWCNLHEKSIMLEEKSNA